MHDRSVRVDLLDNRINSRTSRNLAKLLKQLENYMQERYTHCNKRRLCIVQGSTGVSYVPTCNLLPATSTVWMVAADRSCVAVPRMTASDLSALSCRWFCSNHDRTAAEQLASLSRAGVASLAFMATSSRVSLAN